MKQFVDELLKMSQEITDLKTHGLRTSSSLALADETVGVSMQIVGYNGNNSCAGKQTALIKVATTDGHDALTMATISAGANQLAGRQVSLQKAMIDGSIGYEFKIESGSASDLATIAGGGTVATLDFDITIYATSEFTATITYRTDH